MKTIILITSIFYSLNLFALVNSSSDELQVPMHQLAAEAIQNQAEGLSDQELVSKLFNMAVESEHSEQVADASQFIALCTELYKLDRIPRDWNSSFMRADRQAHFDYLINRCAKQLNVK